MPFFLSHRAKSITELMDDPNCNRRELINTYRQFNVINSLISQWSKIYVRHILPVCQKLHRPCTLLDIGFGGGDIPIKIAQWAKRDGIDLAITAIETDERAYKFVQTIEKPDTVNFKLVSSSQLVNESQKFDVVISNHLLHHLKENEFSSFLQESKVLSRHKVLFNDLERSDLAYALFNIFSRLVFRSSFITKDGLTSIKRSYTKNELREAVPIGWEVSQIFPFRLLLSYRHE